MPGIGVDVVSLTWDIGQPGQRTGMLTIRVQSLAEYKSVMARVGHGTMVGGPQGAYQIVAVDPLAGGPSTYPAEAAIRVKEYAAPFDIKEVMWFGNNFLQASLTVMVVDLDLPMESDTGTLKVLSEGPADYEELRRFLYHPEGSAIRTATGGSWLIVAISDDNGDHPSEGYPKVVTATVRLVPEQKFNAAGFPI